MSNLTYRRRVATALVVTRENAPRDPKARQVSKGELETSYQCVVEHTSRVGRLEVAAILNKLKVLVVFFSEYLAGNCDKNNDNTLERIFVSDGKLLSDAGGVQDKIVAVLT